MENVRERLLKALFDTRAIRVCPAGEPFWYTSGKIGPYYINTHFLYGSEEKANSLLKVIDGVKDNKEECTGVLREIVMKNYNEDDIYRNTIDILVDAIKDTIPNDDYDYISGGERRDWFFSIAAADLLQKPHITIFKDLDAYVFQNGRSERLISVNGARVLHIADLITSASSYERAWIPAIRNAGGVMKHSFVIIDRMQGGSELLEKHGVKSNALVCIDDGVFREACRKNYINKGQLEMVIKYIENPDMFMKEFFKNNPDFIEKALNSGDEKTASRARLCIEKGYCDIS
ncbi:orotate phosphoribosyltransferase [Thermoclostridium stercorarium]|uniref:orotate phosphoribosyltransferase n=1 Tax=Thermoclostridium stercorarium TaxID=1510 RepID=UPI0004ADFE76|nr:orotate phosphoribosyltransferase [Thermoclostridium stercorarium]UZQ86232.1 orotate phosphoribosyltransferase [Thermoclostridium stercorarium]